MSDQKKSLHCQRKSNEFLSLNNFFFLFLFIGTNRNFVYELKMKEKREKQTKINVIATNDQSVSIQTIQKKKK